MSPDVPVGKFSRTRRVQERDVEVCLDDAELLDLLGSTEEIFARARAAVPGEVLRPFMLPSMTALQKRHGGVCGIATGTRFRRLVAKTLARQFGREVEEACSLPSPPGRLWTVSDTEFEWQPSIDGIGAYDHVHRRARHGSIGIGWHASGQLAHFKRSSELHGLHWRRDVAKRCEGSCQLEVQSDEL